MTGRVRRAVAGAAVPAVVLTLALIHPGATVAQVDLHDGAVWLTNSAQLKLGRYNPAVDELNAGLVSTAPDLDVRQDGSDVLLVEPGAVGVVDPATVAVASRAAVPPGSEVSLAGGTVAIADPTTGAVWIRTPAELGGLDTATAAPDLDLGPGGRAVTTASGAVLAVAADGAVWRAGPGDAPERLGSLAGRGRVDAITAVGETVVAVSGTTVRTLAQEVSLAGRGTDVVLQQPGPAAESVVVAGPTALLTVPLGDGQVTAAATGTSGLPAAPVRVGACAHGAWSSGTYLQFCDGEAPERRDLTGVTAADRLVFRVNRDVVVLNDAARGHLWVPLEDPERREPNWADIQPEQETSRADDRAGTRRSTENLAAECDAEPVSPVAVDDQFGVRSGRSTILSVIDNDGTSDCGVLTVSEFDPIPAALGTLVPVRGGRALQLTTAVGARGTHQFTYTVSDGRGAAAPATASVRVTVVDDAVDTPPEQVRLGSFLVEQGAATGYDVLADFIDPEGDELMLVGASVEGPGGARTRWDGALTFQADAATLGRQSVQVLVSDGTSTVEGSVFADVRPPGSLPPLPGPVQASTEVDTPVDVAPLAEARNPTREELRLAAVEQVPGVTVTTDLEGGTFRFVAATPGTYYVPYLLTAGPQQAEGLARIDVTATPDEPLPPVTVRDVVLVPPGGEGVVAPLTNDVDPAGGVLVLQSVTAPEESGVRAAVVDREIVRVDASDALAGPIALTYTVSNGLATAEGEILVQPAPQVFGQQAPVVPPATATVRTGGVVTIPVLARAYDPDGDPLELVRELPEPLGPGEGLLFVSGDVLRYQAPAEPMTVHATFAVVDATGTETAAPLTVTVQASDAAAKAPPEPQDLTARAFPGDTVRIPVPLTGIDGDGDGVSLLGIATVPAKGIVVGSGPDWLEYRALPGEAGLDTFTYAVEDWVGQRSVATVRVGIAERPTTSAQVIARPDDVTVRPGRAIEVRVLANDIDQSGTGLVLESLDLTSALLPDGVVPEIAGRRIAVTTPDEAGVLQIPYVVGNDRGGRDAGLLTVVVDPEAPYLPPVAADVVVPATETINRTEVEVGVLDVAANPSGPVTDLAVSVHPSAADVATVTETGTVVVRLIGQAQTLPYLLTNTDPEAEGISSYAFITVPALGDFPPILRPGEDPPVVVAGERIEIPLDQYVQVGPGKTARVVDTASVSATRADGSELVKDAATLQYRALRTYAGPASISFEVVDGPVADPGTYRTVLTLPITVLAAEAYPPTFAPSVLEVAAGESVRVDLTAFTSDPVGTGNVAYGFALGRLPGSGVTADLDGSVLTLTAGPTVPRGTVGGVGVSIDYGGPEPLEVQVDYRVRASARQIARVLDHTVADAVEGRAVAVPVLDGAFNPFAEPLTVVGVSVDDPTAGSAVVTGDQVTVRPAEGFIGRLVARYRVRDVTGDPQREVGGLVLVTVRGRPDAPTAPRVVEVRDRTVVLSWDAPAHNGEPITGYRVTAQPGALTRECASTTCTIDSLTNDVEYVFTVQARNAVDWSAASPPSTPARPDAVPTAPGTPVLTFGDGRLEATWEPAQSTGSPLTGYTVEVSPRPVSGPATFEVAGTRATLVGLENGTAYAVRVRANNRAPEPGPWSPAALEVPARAPDAPVVGATRVDTPLGGVIEVTWTPPADGGDAVRDYHVTVAGGPGELDYAGGTTARVTGARNGITYTVSVTAVNKAGPGAPGTATAVPFGVPAAVTGIMASASVAAPAGQGTVRVTWAAADDRGSPVIGYEVELADGTLRAVTAPALQHEGLTGGVAQTYRVRALNVAGAGAWSGAVTATPLTVPGRPGPVELRDPVLVDGLPDSITAAWSPPADWGGRTERTYQTRLHVDGVAGAWGAATPGPTATFDLAGRFGDEVWSRDIGVDVRAVTAAGSGPAVSTTRTVHAPPEAVTALTGDLTPDRAAVAVTWVPPAAGPTPTGYVVEHQMPGAALARVTTTEPTVRLTTSDELRADGGIVSLRVWALHQSVAGPAITAEVTMAPPVADGAATLPTWDLRFGSNLERTRR